MMSSKGKDLAMTGFKRPSSKPLRTKDLAFASRTGSPEVVQIVFACMVTCFASISRMGRAVGSSLNAPYKIRVAPGLDAARSFVKDGPLQDRIQHAHPYRS